jgi:pimeloyl-ACP methyl ester carboxylesterase
VEPPVDAKSNLTNSARALSAASTEEAGFLARPVGDLFVVLHTPTGRAPIGSLTICSSLFAEKHTDYRREVRLARALAVAGVAVARFHYRGVGNSAPATGSVEAFGEDALDVAGAVRQLAPNRPFALLGVGAGSVIAAHALLAYPEAPLLLWKPVVGGSKFFRNFFRARVIAATRGGLPTPAPTPELLEQLANEGHVDVMGFRLSKELYESLGTASFSELVAQHPRPVLLQTFQGARAAELEPLVPEWTEAGVALDARPAKLAEDPWFIPEGEAVAAVISAEEERLIANARDWLLGLWGE